MAFLPHKLNVLEQCRISPPSGSVPTPTIIPLSFFDLTWIGWFYAKPVHFYNFHHPKNHFIETVLPKIKNSLSLTLKHLYPLAGNLTWPEDSKKPEIVCKDGDSVSLTVVQSDYDFDHLSGDHAKDVNEFDTLVPKFSSDDDKFIPLLALQITLFPDRGLSIGFNFHHVAVDGRAVANFIKLWATICKFEGDMESFVIPNDLLPLLDRSIVKDPKGLEMNYINGGMEIKQENFNMSKMPVRVAPLVDIVRATFVLGCSDIEKLKKFVTTHWKLQNGAAAAAYTTPPLRVTAFVVTLAHVWICLIKARWGENNASEDIEHLISPVDCRARLDPPLPLSYFGNCVGTIALEAKRSDLLGKYGIAIAAELIAKYIQDMNNCVWKALEKGVFYFKTLPRDRLLSISGSPKFGYYTRDFGWGKPKKVELTSVENIGAISMSDRPHEQGAIELGLVNNKNEMAAFASIFTKTLQALATHI